MSLGMTSSMTPQGVEHADSCPPSDEVLANDLVYDAARR